MRSTPFFLPTLKTALTTGINNNLTFLNIWEKIRFNRFAYQGEQILASYS
jgi:hypothetical protein